MIGWLSQPQWVFVINLVHLQPRNYRLWVALLIFDSHRPFPKPSKPFFMRYFSSTQQVLDLATFDIYESKKAKMKNIFETTFTFSSLSFFYKSTPLRESKLTPCISCIFVTVICYESQNKTNKYKQQNGNKEKGQVFALWVALIVIWTTFSIFAEPHFLLQNNKLLMILRILFVF